MGNNFILCPYCKEEIKTDAIVCKYCHTKLHYTRAELALLAMQSRVTIDRGPVSSSVAWCYWKYGKDTRELQDCLNNCEAAEAIAAVAEKLTRELNKTIFDIIWGGGDIDPKPFEQMVRKRFSRPPKPI